MEWNARLVDNVSGPAQTAAAGVRALRGELAAGSADLKAFQAAGAQIGSTLGGGMSQAAAGATEAAAAATDAGKAAAGASSEAAAAGMAIRPAWAQGTAQAQAAGKAFAASGKAASTAGAAAGGAGKAAAGAGNAAAQAGTKGAGGLLAMSGASKAAEGALGALRGGAVMLLGALGVAGAMSVAKLAMGARGMAQLDAITARTQVNVRQLFARVDPSPVVRAYNRFSQLFSTSTVTGRALGDIFTRSFDALFSAVERAEPYITAFAQGALLGFLTVENGILRARIALFPYTSALDGAVSSTTLLSVAAAAGTLAIGGIVDTVRLGVVVFDALSSAASAAADSIERIAGAARDWKASGFDGAGLAKLVLGVGDALPSGTPDGPAAGRVRAEASSPGGPAAKPAATAPATAAGASAQAAATKGADPQAAAAAGQATGAAMAAGMVAGMKAGQGAVAQAGADLAAAADKGVRDKAEIRSPSRLFRRTAEHMPEGAAQGIRSGADAVDRAAADALVPQLPQAQGARGATGRGTTIIERVEINAPNVFDQGGLAGFVRSVVRGESFDVLESMGVPSS